jgi:hypothetical protein
MIPFLIVVSFIVDVSAFIISDQNKNEIMYHEEKIEFCTQKNHTDSVVDMPFTCEYVNGRITVVLMKVKYPPKEKN